MPGLVCHPQTPTEAVQAIEVEAARVPGGRLELRYVIRGTISRILLPAPRRPAVGHRLWQHTCCEAFLASAPGMGYREFNFSPSGEWAAYAFERYREGGALEIADPRIHLKSTPAELELTAQIPVLPGKVVAALCAVIEEAGGKLSYWALRHPSGKPDFHHPEGFTVELA